MKSLRDHDGRLPGFFAWWGRALAAWLPSGWRRALGLDRGRLLLRTDAPLAEPPAAQADLPRWLLLPAAAGLRRRLSLPAAASDRLREVLGFEIDRQTPFSADAVAFDARLLGRRGSDGQVEAELVVVPKATLDAQLARLGPLAGMLAGVDIEGDDGAPLGVNLLPRAQRGRRRDPSLAWNIALAAIALLATGLMLAQLLHNRQRALAELETRVAGEAEQARAVSLQRQQLVDLIDGRAYVDGLRKQRPAAIEVLDELARRLPDNTWIDKLAIDNDRLLLIGRSGEASALVGRLEGGKPWRSPALTGPLQPDARSGRDRFTLAADLAVPAPATTATGGSDARRH
ncbi:MAG: PilN domain-containing protein [Pseudomonadota bacterium]|nr:PilN domain-containing protein [Pseudomonadota bacterium]